MKVFIVLALCAVASTASVKSLLDGVTFTDVSGRSYTLDDFRGKYLALYHSASWCGPCRRFTPKLINAYNALLGSNFQVIWISKDRNSRDSDSFFKKMPWVRMSFSEGRGYRGQELFKLTNQRYIPAVTIVDPNFRVINDSQTYLTNVELKMIQLRLGIRAPSFNF